MTEQQYVERYPELYHMQALDEGRYDQYHPKGMRLTGKTNGILITDICFN